MKEIKQEIFRAYDIRGLVDRDFDAEWVEVLGRACGTYFRRLGLTQAVVSHDCRHSSPLYQERLAQGLAGTGVDVVCLNMAATPLFYFAVKKLKRHAGIMVTASHNPPEFNGFKIWAGETTIHSDEIQKIYHLMVAGDFETDRGVVSDLNIEPTYLEDLSSQVKLSRPIKVVVDGGNGAGGLMCAELLKRIGAEVVPLYCEPDGNFPNHHPDPIIEENMADLRARVLSENADLGMGLDGDADRLGVIDEKGEMLYGDKLLAIFARSVLANHPGAVVIGEVKCTHLLYKDIAAHGGVPVMGEAGHSLIKARMKETGAILAGEMSGHMFFADRYFGFDDALYAALRLVEIMDQNPGTPVSHYLRDWPKTYNTPEIRVECPDAAKFKVAEKALDYFRTRYSVIDVDGVRITFKDGWGLIRASNTQPALVLRFEAESEKRLAEIRKIIEEPLAGWIQEMS